jgi:serine/threonine-protein kinase RsbW
MTTHHDPAELDRAVPAAGSRPPVVLTIPSDRTLVVLVRSAAGHLGSRIGLTFEELDDLRLAVDEACALLLLPDEIAATGDVLDCRFAEVDGALHITVAAEARPDAAPQVGGFGWNLLSSLVDDLDWSSDGGRAEVRIVKRPAVRRV